MPDIHKRRISNHRVYFDYQARFRLNRCLQRRTTNRQSVSAHGASDGSRRVRGDIHGAG